MTKKKPIRETRRRPGRPPKSDTDSVTVIRQAALAVFARAGFQGASIADIARAAGVAKPLIHYHFASKEELWRAVMAEAFDGLRAEVVDLQRGLAPGSLRQALDGIARKLVRFASRHADIVRIVTDETGRGGPRADWLIATYLTPMYALAGAVVDQISRDQAPGQPPLRPEHFLPAVFGALNFAFVDAPALRAAFGVDVHSDAFIERHGEFLGRLLTEGLAPRQA